MHRLIILSLALALAACSRDEAPAETPVVAEEPGIAAPVEAETSNVVVDRFGEFEVLRYEVPGFDELSPPKLTVI